MPFIEQQVREQGLRPLDRGRRRPCFAEMVAVWGAIRED